MFACVWHARSSQPRSLNTGTYHCHAGLVSLDNQALKGRRVYSKASLASVPLSLEGAALPPPFSFATVIRQLRHRRILSADLAAGAKRLSCPKAGAMVIPEDCVTELIHAIEGTPTPARPVPVPAKSSLAAEGSRAGSQPLAALPQQHFMQPLPDHPAPRARTGILTEAEFCGYMPRSSPRSASPPIVTW